MANSSLSWPIALKKSIIGQSLIFSLLKEDLLGELVKTPVLLAYMKYIPDLSLLTLPQLNIYQI
jgi:hypothetical protein